MTAAIILFVVGVVAIDAYQWRQCRHAPLTESFRKIAFVFYCSLSERTRNEFILCMNKLTFKGAAKAFLMGK